MSTPSLLAPTDSYNRRLDSLKEQETSTNTKSAKQPEEFLPFDPNDEEETSASATALAFCTKKKKEEARMANFASLLQNKGLSVSTTTSTHINEESKVRPSPQENETKVGKVGSAIPKPNVPPLTTKSAPPQMKPTPTGAKQAAIKPKFSLPALGAKKGLDLGSSKGLPPLKMGLASTNPTEGVQATMSVSQFLEGIRTVKPTLSLVKPKPRAGGTTPVRHK